MKKIIALLSALAIALPTVSVSADNYSVQGDDYFVQGDDFWAQLSGMVTQNMEDDYFGSLNLTVGSDTMTLDGEELKIDDDGSVPVVENDSTLLPIRGVAEAIGAQVDYHADSQTVSLTDNEMLVSIQIGSADIEINGEISQMPVSAKVENDRTLIPLRAAAEALGCEVEWDQDTKGITLTKPYQSKRVIVYSSEADTSYASDVIVGEDMTIMQFDTEEDAKAAVERNISKGLMAEPDYICNISSLSWGTDRINAPAYRNANGSSHSDLVVAVIDTGLDSKHSCFRNRIVSGYDLYHNDSTPEDRQGHGTHVASTVADVTSGYDKIKIMPIKVFGDSGSTSTSIITAGVEYAIKAGVDVINMSLSGPGESQMQRRAVEKAVSNNITVVVAAGNDNSNLTKNFRSPACFPAAVTVASLDSNNQKSSFSNYGNGIIDIAAPGRSVNGAAIGGGEKLLSGTSMAAPHVAGAIALMRSINPALTTDQAVSMIKNSADNMGNSTYYGAGMLNMANLITKSTPAPTQVPTPKPTAKPTAIPTSVPTAVPTDVPTFNPTQVPLPTQEPAPVPTEVPILEPELPQTLWVTTEAAELVLANNATVRGTAEYSGNRPSEVGLYFGTTPDNMKVVASEGINFSKNPFEIWYDLENEVGIKLSPNTTYYYMIYAKQDGMEVCGEVRYFTTNDQPTTTMWVTTGGISSLTSSNATLRGSASYSGNRPTEVGLMFGTSPTNMNVVARDSINFTKNPFDIWYDLNKEAGQYLTGGITYYYRMYGVQNGITVYGEMKSFTAPR